MSNQRNYNLSSKVSQLLFFLLITLNVNSFAQSETESNNTVNDVNVQTISSSTTITGDVCLGGACPASDPVDYWKIVDGASGSFIATWSSNVQVTLFTYATSARNTAPTSVVLTSGVSRTLSASSFYAINVQFVSVGVLTSYSIALSGTSLPVANNAPTASSFTAANGPYEDLTYIFTTADFGYNDSDGDALSHLLIESLPAAGTLYLDADNDDVFDSGEQVTVSAQISKANLDAGNLQYVQNGSANTSFQFEVNDGTDNSSGNYIATLNVTPVPTVTLAVSPSVRLESNSTTSTISAALSNSYGADVTVNLSFSGTASIPSDYLLTGTSITIPAGDNLGTLSFASNPDNLYEGNETVVVDIASVVNGAENGTQQVTYTITDDDSQPTVSLLLRDIYNPITDESGGQAYIVAQLDAVSGVTTSVPLTFSGTATGGGTDYSITGSTIILSPGEVRDSIRVTSQFDNIEEGNETVIIDMGVPTNATENGTQQVILIINDEDASFPSVTLSSSESSPTNNTPFGLSITFSEPVTGFNSSDLVINGAYVETLVGSGANYTADIVPDTLGVESTITINLPPNAAFDQFGNGNSVATEFSIGWDGVSPSLVINSASGNPTNSSPIPVSFIFSESVTGFTLSDIVVSNGTASNFAGSGDTYFADITPFGDGLVTINVGAAACTDLAGNNVGAQQLLINYDGTTPTITISSTESDPTNSSLFSITIAFSESVTGFTVGDIAVGNGTASNFAGSGDTYTADITPTGDGIVTIDINANIAQDLAGNGNTAATQFRLNYDGTVPTVTITSIESSPTNNSSFPVTISFSESVTGFTLSDINVNNAVATNFSGSVDSYAVEITPSADGLVTIDVSAGVATDAAGNLNVSATQLSLIYDSTSPTTQITTVESNPTSSSPFTVSIEFSESVSGFSLGDILVGNGIASNFSGSGDTYTADITPAGDGAVTVDVGTGLAIDAVGNSNIAATQLSLVYDGTSPTVAITTGASDPTNSSPFSATFTFSESVTGFTLGDITVGNGLASNFAGSGNTYTADITPAGAGTVTVDVGAGVATDAAGNDNTAATQLSRIYDAISPTVAITTGISDPTNTSPFSATFNFSESVTEFTLGDISVGNGSASNFAGSGTIYTADITPTGDGTVTIDVGAGVAIDAAGNSNTAATQLSLVYDGTAPAGYSAAIDLLGEIQINMINETILEFNGTGLEVGSTLNYSFTSNGGGVPVTGIETVTSVNETFNNGGAGYDVSDLVDGEITLTVFLTDIVGNIGSSVTNITTKDAGPPTGYSIEWDDALINAAEASATTFTISNAEIGTNINATITSSAGGTPVTVISPSTVASSSQIVTVDLSALSDGTLTVQLSLTDGGGNIGAIVTDNSATLDQTAPIGYTATIDQVNIILENQNALSFAFEGAEIGSTYNYQLTSTGGGTVSGTGTITTSPDQIQNIDVSGLGDGILTLSVTLTDDAGNVGGVATDNVTKDANAPVFITVDDDGGDNSYRSGESLTILAVLGETGLEVEADLSVINTELSASALFADNGDGTYSITINDVDKSGNLVESASTMISLTATDALGNFTSDNSLQLLLDKIAPSGYTVSIDQSEINLENQTALSFTLANVEVGNVYNYTISSTVGRVVLSGSGTVASTTDQVTGIDVSALGDGSLTVSITLSDVAENVGVATTDMVVKSATQIQFQSARSISEESISTASIQVNLSIVSAQDVSVDYTVSGSATGGGTDHSLADGTLTISSGNLSETIDLTDIVDDEIIEGEETIIITLSNPNNATLGVITEHTFIIIDNDRATLSIEATTQAAEDTDNGLFTIRTSQEFTRDVLVSYDISGTATEGEDYEVIGNDILFPALTSAITIPVNIIPDSEIEGDESVIFSITATDYSAVIFDANNSAEVIITDNDAKLPQTISFQPIVDKVLGDDPITLLASSDSGLPVTFSLVTEPAFGVATLINDVVFLEGPGMVTVVASQAGSALYEPATNVTQTFYVTSGELVVPTLFTPNGDGTNDSFIIRGSARVSAMELNIFDRDGNLVFSSSNINQLLQIGWDGRSSGKAQPQGAYVWVVKGSFSTGEPLLINGKSTGIIRLAR